jgi:uncharacterized sodium:solute symporter family permease YidK
MDCNWCIYFCIEHRIGTPGRFARCWCRKRNGYGPLGNAWLAYSYLGWFFVPFYARSGVFTMPEFLEKRYNANARSFLSIISLVSYILTKVAVTVYAGGVVFKDVFNIDYINFMGYSIDFFWISAIGLVLITGLYTTFGG